MDNMDFRELWKKQTATPASTDELFQKDFPESCNLFIFVSQHEISFAVSDRKNRTFVALES